MILRFVNAAREPLADTVNVELFRGARRSGACLGLNAEKPLVLDSLSDALTLYRVHVWPRRHRAVSQFVYGDAEATIFCPVEPRQVRALHVTPEAARAIPLEPSALAALSDLQMACVLNLWAALRAVIRPPGQPLTQAITRIVRVEPDRAYVEVAADLERQLATDDGFVSVPGHLHAPPAPGYRLVSSYKHRATDVAILQLTFFVSETDPSRWMADLDLDDAGGIGHLVQVLDHWVTNGHTHPYDIHEMLVYARGLDPGYTLVL